MLGVSESGYYAWIDRPDPPRTLRRIWLAGEIADVHKASGGPTGRCESRPSCATAVRSSSATTPSGRSCANGLKGLPTRRLPKGARVAKVMSLDLVRREFAATRPTSCG
jgi:hypothetical protein